MAEPWPVATPRDEMLARVATAGRRRLLWRHAAIVAAAGALLAAAAAGMGAGRSGGIDLVAESTSLRATSIDASAPFSRCPGGDAIGELHRDDRVFLTGRDDDGAWVELRSPSGAGDRVWVQAAVVAADDDVARLPVRDCRTDGDQLALPGETTTTLPPTTVPGEATTTTTVPGQTTTTQASGPTIPTTQAPTTTTTTAAADTTPPSVTGLAADINEIFTADGNCGVQPKSTPVEAVVSDAGGIASVTLGWSFQSTYGPVSGTKAMTLSGGKYRADFGPFPNAMGTDESVIVTWTVRAVDSAGNPRQVSVGKAERITVSGPCFG